MGQLGLARAELEALAGSGALDNRSLLVLAEARWRTGDLTGAGDAAQAYLGTGGDDIVALVIAAEATAAIGRPTEARRLAGRVLERADRPLDLIFAGQRRSLIWPVDTTEAATAEGMFPRPGHETSTEVVPAPIIPEQEPEEAPVEHAPPVEAATPSPDEPVEAGSAARREGFWDFETIRAEELPIPGEELDTARADLAGGDLSAAALHLGIALRMGPDLAGEVLDAIEPVAGSPELYLIRGDALRLLGREDDARRAYAEASLAIVRRQASPQEKPAIASDLEEEA
jgi:hypothetical protein